MSTSRVSAIPDHLDRFASSDITGLCSLRLLANELATRAERMRAGCPHSHPRGNTVVVPILEDAMRHIAAVALVAQDFRRADLRVFVADAVNALPPAVRGPMTAAGRVYLRADDGGDGRRMELLGDLATAEHVVFLVPGMTNSLGNYETQLRPKAVALYNEMRAQLGSGARVAVIAWLGYNTPDATAFGLIDAATSVSAERGARQLRADLDLLYQHGMRAHVTIVGHSYGSVVAGRAMKQDPHHPLPVDDVVVVGSPGMDANSRRELMSPDVRVWAGKTSTPGVPSALVMASGSSLFLLDKGLRVIGGSDVVPMAPVHGRDPAAKEFGARSLPTDGHGHSEYFTPGTQSLKSIAWVAVGFPKP